ncbi:sensor histidine kinase [Solihabitans fulvus]|uniref:histidine kinase n=2 Tax=Solihabitans fulvus TaxID=1892852 RepID=A0A5B2XCS9_9PSEU|nr:sensor histidine kinase [Solihabitans fulvus]
MWWMGVRPELVTAVVLSAGTGIQLLCPAIGPGVTLVVLCTFAWLRPARVSMWGLAGAVLLGTAATASTGHWVAAALSVVGALLAWSWGALGRARSARRQAEARRAVLEERARIARELHDVLAHTVSVMVIQASAADDVFDLDPAKARKALRDLESSGREALAELRRFLLTVRSVDDERAGEPQPGLSELDRLARSVSTAGLDVVVRLDSPEPLGRGVELSAYRIVQESLTNTLRHARASRAEVVVRVADGHLLVEVRDNGRGGGRLADHGAGHGILGMRERATMLGGTLDAGPDPAGGFLVRALLPTAQRTTPEDST